MATGDAHAFKLCMDLVTANTKTCTIDLAPDSIGMAFMDSKSSVFVVIAVPTDRLSLYAFNTPTGKTMSVSLPTRPFYRVLKSMRKKDALDLQFGPDAMSVRIFPEQKDRVIEASIKTQQVKTVNHQFPPADTYTRDIEIASSDFTKLLKDLCGTSQTVTISMYESECVEFRTDTKRIVFGRAAAEPEAGEVVYTNEFDSTSILSILKITSISKQLHVAAAGNQPLKLSAHIGSLGTVDAYIKPIELKSQV